SLVLGLASPALAEDVVPDNKKPEEIKKDEGWNFILTPGLSLAFADNRAVVGQTDGSTFTLGVNLLAGFDFRSGDHQIRTRLTINEAFNRNPVLEEFVKSTDIFKFEALYLYSILPWLGPYARFSLDTTMLEGFDHRAQATQWHITYLDGTTLDRWGYNLRLTDGFQPLTIKESAGFFAKPYDTAECALEFRAGFGGLHGVADGQKAVKDDGGTPMVEVLELDSFDQGGVELGMSLWGEVFDKKVSYKVGAEFMMPVIYSLPDGDDRGTGELTNIDINATLSFKLLSWMSLDYVFRAMRQPQMVDAFQIQNSLLLTASYAFFQPEEKK
ncbi:MAG TPA: hypothetical protein P5076_21465, partial [Myxococcota bacterium]|nr:hypothetical protein [Myxococcota bacterium]